MDERKKIEKELLKKKLAELRDIAACWQGFTPKYNWTKKMFTKALLDAGYGKPEKIVPVSQQIKERREQQPENPAFEQAAQAEPEQPKQEKRGGVRPGAGRPPGMTDEKAKVRNLPQVPSTPIKQGLQSLFDVWAAAAKIEQLALKDDEAEALALPITQLQEYYFPGVLPEIAGTWIMLVFASSRIIKPRIDMVNIVRKKRKESRIRTGFEDRTKRHYRYRDGDELKPLHAIDASEPAAYTEDLDDVTCDVCKKLIDEAKP